MKVPSGFVKVWDRIIDVMMVLAGILFWFQMVIVNIEVFSRYFIRPTIWVAEISSILILWIPFMVAAWVLRKDAHVRMDLLLQRLKPRTQALINGITYLTGTVVMLIVAGAGLLTAIYWIGNKTPTMLMLPRSPIIGIIFVGSLLFAVQFFINAMIYLDEWKTQKIKAHGPEEALSA
jgi:TRAP-type C4-dicarboxylate transport system permease small subunit